MVKLLTQKESGNIKVTVYVSAKVIMYFTYAPCFILESVYFVPIQLNLVSDGCALHPMQTNQETQSNILTRGLGIHVDEVRFHDLSALGREIHHEISDTFCLNQ